MNPSEKTLNQTDAGQEVIGKPEKDHAESHKDQHLQNLIERLVYFSQGAITQEDIKDAIFDTQRNRFLALAYSIQNRKSQEEKRRETFQNLGEKITKKNGTQSFHGEGLLFQLLKTNNIENIEAKECVKDLISNYDQSLKELQEKFPERPFENIQRKLDQELYQNSNFYQKDLKGKDKTPEELIRSFCTIVISQIKEKKSYLEDNLANYQLNPDISEFTRENPLVSLYKIDKETGEIGYHDGKPIPNPDLPPEWRSKVDQGIKTPIQTLLDQITDQEFQEEIYQIQEILGIRSKVLIPLEIAWEKLLNQYKILAEKIIEKKQEFIQNAIFNVNPQVNQNSRKEEKAQPENSKDSKRPPL